MAVRTEPYITEDRRELVRTFSDRSRRIRRNDGVLYDEAIDPPDSGRTYTETDDPLEVDEVTADDRDYALRKFGVEV